MKSTLALIILFFLFSCEDGLLKCNTFSDCNKNEECRFTTLDNLEGICVNREKCIDYRCKSNRLCIDNYCGTLDKPVVEDINLEIMNGKEFYYKIEVQNISGNYFFRIKNELPKGLIFTELGEIKGKPNDIVKKYNINVELINGSKDSYYFYNYKKIEKEIVINLIDLNLCLNIECDLNEECKKDSGLCKLKLEDGKSRINLKNGDFYDGEILYIWNHNNWWWDKSNNYTYALFNDENYLDSNNDNSIMFFDSYEIEKVENNPYQFNLNNYNEFLIRKDIVLELPLDGISYIANSHESYHIEEDGYGDFAWDFVRLNENGDTFINDGEENSDYFVWDNPIYLPISGYLFDYKDVIEDNKPGSYIDKSDSNLIGIEIKGNYLFYILHLKKGSLPMKINHNCEPDIPNIKCIEYNQYLDAGTYIGRVGNSGVSLVPHLHMTLFWYDRKDRVWSIPSFFKNIYSSSENNNSTFYEYYDPKSFDFVSKKSF